MKLRTTTPESIQVEYGNAPGHATVPFSSVAGGLLAGRGAVDTDSER
jgi:hypothetical protein